MRTHVYLLAIALALAGCSSPGPSSTPSAPTAAGSGPASAPTEGAPLLVPSSEPTQTPPRETMRIDSCIVGEWKLTDASAYFVTAAETPDTQIEYLYSTGQVIYAFGPGGVFLLEADNFTQEATLKFRSGGVSVDVPLSMFLDGIALADYTVDGERVIFTKTSTSSLLFQVTVWGETTDLNLFGETSGEPVAFLYECVGSDRLLLTPPIKDYEVFPLQLQRLR